MLHYHVGTRCFPLGFLDKLTDPLLSGYLGFETLSAVLGFVTSFSLWLLSPI